MKVVIRNTLDDSSTTIINVPNKTEVVNFNVFTMITRRMNKNINKT